MSVNEPIACPECAGDFEPAASFDRRAFLRTIGGTAAALAAGGAVPRLRADEPTTPAAPRPAEAMIRELYQGLSAEQRRSVVYSWNHGATATQQAVRLRMMNSAFGRRIGQAYTQPQQELVRRIIRAICADDEGFAKINTVLDRDNFGGNWTGAGANIFGNPADGQFAFVLTSHHMTLRCDGNSAPNTAFGGPIYYGHSPDGFSERNVFNFQTRCVRNVFEALSEGQRTRALLNGSPGEQYQSVRFRASGQAMPGLPASELTSDQRRLVEAVMRDLLAPYRREDGDEVMDIVRRNGGLERLHLAFYRDRNNDNTRWHFWRIEGPGFVWNYRVLPHVHCYVNIAVPEA